MPFIDTDFSDTELPTPFAAADHQRWDWASSGSPTVMQFVTGAIQAYEISPGHGGGWLAHVYSPQSLNQSVEVMVAAGNSSTYGTAGTAGCFVRFEDTSNFVAFQINLITGKCELIQRIAGTYHTIANPGTLLRSDTPGGSIKIEVIGKFVRAWYQPAFFPCDDESPSIEGELISVPEDGVATQWGVFMQSSATAANFHVTHFKARELNNVFLPPPTVVMVNAIHLNLTPITIHFSGVPDGTERIETQISPIDKDDYSEPYADMIFTTPSSRVFWVRPGYTYSVRMRLMNTLGQRGDWVTQPPITAPGTKVLTETIIYPDDVFPADVIPSETLDHTLESNVDSTQSATDRERTITYPGTPVPRRRFTLTFENLTDIDIVKLQQFFEDMQGRLTPFTWQHPTSGELVPVRFNQDQFTSTFDDIGVDYPIVSTSLEIIEVKIGIVPQIIPNLTLDSTII